MMITARERIRCVKKQESIPVYAKSWDEFKSIIERNYSGFGIVFTKLKARVNPFSVHRVKLTWVNI